jgi:quinol monooxygenase YgiN
VIQLLVSLTAASGHSQELVQALQPLARRATQSAGCRGAHLAADVDDAQVFWYCEEWDDVQALEAKLRSESFTEFLALAETSVTQPFIEFRVVQESRGLDYVSAVRRGHDSGSAPGGSAHPTPSGRPR